MAAIAELKPEPPAPVVMGALLPTEEPTGGVGLSEPVAPGPAEPAPSVATVPVATCTASPEPTESPREPSTGFRQIVDAYAPIPPPGIASPDYYRGIYHAYRWLCEEGYIVPC